jgi:hypothetical protein
VSNYATPFPCGCQVILYDLGHNKWREDLEHCPLHKAAPELLEALKAVTPSYRTQGCWCERSRDRHSEACKNAQAAIAKAESRS